MSQSFTVDIGAREAAFVYVDGKILIGENDEIHSDIINKYGNIVIDMGKFSVHFKYIIFFCTACKK